MLGAVIRASGVERWRWGRLGPFTVLLLWTDASLWVLESDDFPQHHAHRLEHAQHTIQRRLIGERASE
ncbi:hypothetical protein ASF71_20800 [Deinococcus sp. Leaf326]|nr:hypothetical protein ASF71_20800 [Deinococcus sp. Leaf326]